MRECYRDLSELWTDLPEGYEVLNLTVTCRNNKNNIIAIKLLADEDGGYSLISAMEYIGDTARDLTVRRETP